MSLLRAALALAAAIALAFAVSHVVAYRQLAESTPAAHALVRAVQDAEEVEVAIRARERWRDHSPAPPAPSATTSTPRVPAPADADARLRTAPQPRRPLPLAAVGQLLSARGTAFRWWALAVLTSLGLGLALAPRRSFFRSVGASVVPLVTLVSVLATLWLERGERIAVLSLLDGAAPRAAGPWRLAKLSLLLLTTGMHAAVVLGAARAWLEQFRAGWTRLASGLGRTFDDGLAALTRPRRASAPAAGTDSAAAGAPRPGTPTPICDLATFGRLMRLEWAGILAMRARVDGREPERPAAGDFTLEATTVGDEPYVCFRAADLTGLALSGGGIRSATFNLGLLQGLHRIGLLPRIDYLATVSGGGYIGSFWSKWLVATRFADTAGPATLRDIFPGRPGAGTSAQLDSDQERHLREFGRFLSPRVGLLEVETWTALVAAIAGLLPALAIALSLIGTGLVGWLLLTVPLGIRTRLASALTMALLTIAVLTVFELLWQKVKLPLRDQSDVRVTARRRDLAKLMVFSVAAVALVAALHAAIPTARTWWRTPRGAQVAQVPAAPEACGTAVDGDPQPPGAGLSLRRLDGAWTVVCPGTSGWWELTGLRVQDATATFFSPSLFDYAWVWLAAGLVLLLARLAHPLFPLGEDALWVAPLDRVIMRLLGLATFWAAAAALWHLALNLDSLALSAGTAVASAGAFTLLRNWIGVALQKPDQPGAASRLRAVLPQVLAYVTLLLTLATVGQALIRLCGDSWPAWWMAAAGMGGTLLLGLFIDPAEFGLHAFYRARISRAYAGASNLAPGEGAAGNRQTDPRAGDDDLLARLAPRPLHLVCCAANDLNGDDIGTLGRGARSAVLSRYGLSLGPFASPSCPPVTLGAAVTASAAAFNSNMGDVSMKLGPAVSFVMTALNLRLGLWLRHPVAHAAATRRWPGLLLYREYFGMTTASGQVVTRTHRDPHSGQVYVLADAPTHMRDVHLSDGGHFENLAIYELVRRHCRYILASDCGADPAVAFDDLGRALRRIRQDFGIDITIDVEPLRPDAQGRSRQHVAVGRIHYSPTDVGILLYVKPTLTGDELADVLQYKTRNGAFPHEGTGDQFYDEAQWESYRRLGRHVAETVFGFVPPADDPSFGAVDDAASPSRPADASRLAEPPRTPRKLTADWVFGEASVRWGTTPADLEARVLEMTARLAELELDLQQSGARALLREVFPELDAWDAGPPLPEASAAATGDGADLVAILRVTQMMEDVWMACDLDTWWSHPLNMGWVNFFARWVTAPTFRFWWPFLGPMYSKGFRDFVDDRFPMPETRADVPATSPGSPRSVVRALDGTGIPTGLAASWWATRSAQRCPWARPAVTTAAPPRYYENVLALDRPGRGPVDVQVGLVATWEARDPQRGRYRVWTCDDFFVPPSLWGAGLGWRFLEHLLHLLADDHDGGLVVVRGPRSSEAHRVSAEDTRNFVDQYRKMGFRQRSGSAEELPLSAELQAVLQGVGFDAALDTLLEVRLARWKARQR